jgi:hypothetical protein
MLRATVILAAVALFALASAPAFSQLASDSERIFSGGASSDLVISYSSQVR